MDSTRISIARILALGVPLTWQDAVAVAQEAAMLSDVNAAMNSRPSLVSPETCVITRAGDLELPETTEIEDPDAVADLLRAMLGESDVPEPLEALAFGASARDLSTDLAAFPVGNRRAVIARLATRALTSPGAPAANAAPTGPAVSVASAPRDDAPPRAAAVERPPAPIPFPAPATQMPPPFVATPRPAVVVQPPPFVAAQAAASALPAAVEAQVPPPVPAPARAPSPTPARTAADPPPAAAPRAVGPAPPAPDAELRRLRTRSVERDARNQRVVARLMRWLAWRPNAPDPRLLGGAAVVIAAIVSMLWRNGAAPSPAGSTATGAAAVIAGTTPPAAAAASPERRAATLPASPGPAAPSGAATTRAPRPAAPRPDASDGSRGSAVVEAPRPAPETAAPIVTPPPAPTSTPILIPAPTVSAGGAPPEPTRRSAPVPSGSRGGRGRPTLYSANDADVAPPVMLRQQLPSSLLEPDSEVPPDWPYLELLIDETGAVERVRLRAKAPAPGQTLYRHRMLVAAAKAWQFEPAHLNGQPVRYVMRVPLEP